MPSYMRKSKLKKTNEKRVRESQIEREQVRSGTEVRPKIEYFPKSNCLALSGTRRPSSAQPHLRRVNGEGIHYFVDVIDNKVESVDEEVECDALPRA